MLLLFFLIKGINFFQRIAQEQTYMHIFFFLIKSKDLIIFLMDFDFFSIFFNPCLLIVSVIVERQNSIHCKSEMASKK